MYLWCISSHFLHMPLVMDVSFTIPNVSSDRLLKKGSKAQQEIDCKDVTDLYILQLDFLHHSTHNIPGLLSYKTFWVPLMITDSINSFNS